VPARRLLGSTLLAAVLVATAVSPAASADTAPASTADPAATCAAMSAPVYRVNQPVTEASLVTASATESQGTAARYGFTEDGAELFRAATAAGDGLVPVYRLWSPTTGDFLSVQSTGDRNRAIRFGYVEQKVAFYASPVELPCTVPVYRLTKGTKHRLAVSETDRTALEGAGWKNEGPRFWAVAPEPLQTPPTPPGPPTPPEPPADGTDTKFTVAVLPDTQEEVFGNGHFINRSEWLAANRDQLDLRFVVHTGDVVNWDTPDHAQYESASAALLPLEAAGVPLSLTIGNHDTNATGEGGSGRPGANVRVEVRNTTTFNWYFSTERLAPEGVFEPGKIDNSYQLFSAGGEDWMILSLELWPRVEVVDWAKSVVAANPDRNVIISTHSYLEADGSLPQIKEYGATSPQYLYDNLVSVYPNIKVVLSGHVGTAAQRVDTGVNGNRIVSLLGAFHSATSNHIRLLEFDTATDTLSTRFYSPINGKSFPQWNATFDGMQFD
jgi:hypothetical protein